MSAAKPTDSPVSFLTNKQYPSYAVDSIHEFQAHHVQAKGTPGTGAESPTTVRPLDMDDDDVQETVPLSGEAPTTASASRDSAGIEAAPPKPPRPLSAQQQAENTLKEAFPSIDAAVVKAVLHASGGRVEPAFNALLGMAGSKYIQRYLYAKFAQACQIQTL